MRVRKRAAIRAAVGWSGVGLSATLPASAAGLAIASAATSIRAIKLDATRIDLPLPTTIAILQYFTFALVLSRRSKSSRPGCVVIYALVPDREDHKAAILGRIFKCSRHFDVARRMCHLVGVVRRAHQRT